MWFKKYLNTTEKREKARKYIVAFYLFYFLMPIILMSGILPNIFLVLIVLFFPSWIFYFALMYVGLGHIYVIFAIATAFWLNIKIKNKFLKYEDDFNLDLDDLYNSYLEIIDDLHIMFETSSDSQIEKYLDDNAEIAIETIFHKVNLEKLYTNNYISRDVFFKSKRLYKLVRKLQDTEYWSLESVKTLKEWKEIFEVTQKLKASLNIIKS